MSRKPVFKYGDSVKAWYERCNVWVPGVVVKVIGAWDTEKCPSYVVRTGGDTMVYVMEYDVLFNHDH